ncbi:MAG TPA: Rrf2 family transcriptional regulator [Planctomycetaceae bacterium]|nr:Rrf2 family transcriptional regulator [Planctomycetaceae bacterium]
MRLSLQTDFALRTLIYLATTPGRATIAGVAGFYGISAAHVAKAVQQLARRGYIRSIRGIGGGIELARRPEDIALGSVILDFEGNLHLLECVAADGVCVIESFCKLKRVLAEAERVQLEYLSGVTLRDVLPTHGQWRRVESRPQPA